MTDFGNFISLILTRCLVIISACLYDDSGCVLANEALEQNLCIFLDIRYYEIKHDGVNLRQIEDSAVSIIEVRYSLCFVYIPRDLGSD